MVANSTNGYRTRIVEPRGKNDRTAGELFDFPKKLSFLLSL